MTVELNCSSVPNFLKSSNLYKNFEFNGDESIFTIPQKYIVNEIKIKSIEDLSSLLHVIRFWMLDETPFQIYKFVEDNDIDYSSIIKEFDGMKVIDEINILIEFRNKFSDSESEKSSVESKSKQKYYSDPMVDTAVKYGCLNLLKYSKEQQYFWDINTTYLAVKYEHFEILKYLHENGCAWNEDCTKEAASKKDLRFLEYLHQEKCHFDFFVASEAARHKNLKALKFIFDNNYPWDESACDEAAKKCIECLKFLIENDCPTNDDILERADSNFVCFKYLYEKGFEFSYYLPTPVLNPFVSCDLEFVKYLIENEIYFDNRMLWIGASNGILVDNKKFSDYCLSKCVPSIEISSFAIYNNDIDLLIFSHNNGCIWNEETFNKAIKHSIHDLECLKYLHQNDCPTNEDCCLKTLEYDADKCLKYLHENGFPWDCRLTYQAVENTSTNCLMYAIENGCPRNKDLIVTAVSEGNYDILNYLHECGEELYDDCIYTAIENYEMRCLKYLIENNCPCPEDICTISSQIGNLEALKYLHIKGFKLEEDIYKKTITKKIYCNNEFEMLECLEYLKKNGCKIPST